MQAISVKAGFVAAAALTLAACGDTGVEEPAAQEGPITIEADEDISPAIGPSVLGVVGERPELATLSGLIEQTNLVPAIEGTAELTLFAPNEDAFEGMEPTAREFLLDEANVRSLRDVLGYHMLRNDVSTDELRASIEGGADQEALMTTSNNFQISARMNDEGEPVIVDGRGNEAQIVESIDTVSGTVHIVDEVLLPPQ